MSITDIALADPKFRAYDFSDPELRTLEHKGFYLERDRQTFHLWHVAKSDMGSIPTALTGKYTRIEFLKDAIDKYLDDNKNNNQDTSPKRR